MTTDVEGTRPLERPRSRFSGAARVWFLNLAIAAAAWVLYEQFVTSFTPDRGDTIHVPWYLLALGFYVAEVAVVHLEFRRDAYSFSLAEIPLVVGFFFSSPTEIVWALLLGDFVALAIHRRQSLMKLVFNLGHYALETCVAIIVFASLVQPGGAVSPANWGIALVAAYCASFISILMVPTAISLSEGHLRFETFAASWFHGSVVTITNTSLGLLGAYVMTIEIVAAVLICVPAALLYAAYRAYVTQLAKSKSVEFLYESTRLVHHNLETEAAIATLLAQAKKMFRAEVAQFTLFGEGDDDVAHRTMLSREDTIDSMVPVRLDPREGVWARVASEGRAILVPRPIENERLKIHFASRGIFKDAMVAPIFRETTVVGTILVGDRSGDVSTFDFEDLRLFETLANHASVILENTRLVDRLRDSLAHLTEMNRLKDDFVAAVSHELRTPLTSIQGYVKTLLRPEMETYDPAQRRSFLEAVDRQSDRLRSLIEDLLIVARLEAHQVDTAPTVLQLRTTVDQVIDELADQLKGRDVVTEIPTDVPVITSDPGKVHQILTNLIENARKYTPDGAAIKVAAHVEGGGITIDVIDRGTGIPPELQDRIFDRFYQVDQSSTRAQGGTGLGLYICRRLAEALGGRIWLERSDANGSVFSLWLPFAIESRTPAPPLPEPAPN